MSNGDLDAEVNTAFSYDKTNTVTYTYRIYAWPTVNNTNPIPVSSSE